MKVSKRITASAVGFLSVLIIWGIAFRNGAGDTQTSQLSYKYVRADVVPSYIHSEGKMKPIRPEQHFSREIENPGESFSWDQKGMPLFLTIFSILVGAAIHCMWDCENIYQGYTGWMWLGSLGMCCALWLCYLNPLWDHWPLTLGAAAWVLAVVCADQTDSFEDR